jgi:hypothetical protein
MEGGPGDFMMDSFVTGTVQQGAIHLDQPLTLPDNSRVQVIIQPLPETTQAWMEKFEEFVKYCEEHPVYAGVRYTREQLHERR